MRPRNRPGLYYQRLHGNNPSDRMDAFGLVYQEIRAEPETLLAEIDREAAQQSSRSRIVRKPLCLIRRQGFPAEAGRPERVIADHNARATSRRMSCEANRRI